MTPPTRPTGAARPPGTLVLVSTPIGNLGDLSPRAAATLARVGVIACEDTRHTRRLLTHAGVSGKELLAVHDHNEAAQVDHVLRLLDRGVDVAVVTDAGTPAISDPGARLVAAAAAAGARVEAVPGPSALVAALVVSGLPSDRFCFEGFLPRKGRERVQRLQAIAAERRTTVLYEAPQRVPATLADLSAACGPLRGVAVARELTKLHEEVWRGTLEDALAWVAETAPRGEHVLVVGGAPEPEPASDEEVTTALRAKLGRGLPAKEAIPLVAAELGVPKRRVYEASVRIRAEGG
ncbi:MAG TPA: 16S rRNA (cytidine(1402)-2'-O)-methyltransferase [Acidimicrobiales bacterium]|nr:16S rRNA (cytidine(1402)-2'-O)-methyltransferase [Acidimicrobiales bacterium]